MRNLLTSALYAAKPFGPAPTTSASQDFCRHDGVDVTISAVLLISLKKALPASIRQQDEGQIVA